MHWEERLRAIRRIKATVYNAACKDKAKKAQDTTE